MSLGQNQRDTLLVESAEVLSQQAFAGDQYLLKLAAPRVAERAQPGQFGLTLQPEHGDQTWLI